MHMSSRLPAARQRAQIAFMKPTKHAWESMTFNNFARERPLARSGYLSYVGSLADERRTRNLVTDVYGYMSTSGIDACMRDDRSQGWIAKLLAANLSAQQRRFERFP